MIIEGETCKPSRLVIAHTLRCCHAMCAAVWWPPVSFAASRIASATGTFRPGVKASPDRPAQPCSLGPPLNEQNLDMGMVSLFADYLEILKGPSRSSAHVVQTRFSTTASPRACVSSATSSSIYWSQLGSPVFPVTSVVLLPSWNSGFHQLIACSDTFSQRATPARLISPVKIDNTIRNLLLCRNSRQPSYRDLLPTPQADHPLNGLQESMTRNIFKTLRSF